jgi:hypothetical protein
MLASLAAAVAGLGHEGGALAVGLLRAQPVVRGADCMD